MKFLHKPMKFDDRIYKITDVLMKHDCKLPIECIIELSYLIKEDKIK